MKLRYAGPFFRYERPQAGRYRQLQQVGVEAIGVDDPALDAEVLAVADAGLPRPGPARLPPASSPQPRRREHAARSTAPSCTAVPREARPRRRHPRARPDQPAAGARRQAPRGPRAARRRPADGRPPLRRGGRALRRGQARTSTTSAWPTSRPRGWCAGWTTTRRRPSSSSHDGLGSQSGIGGGGRYDGLMAALGGQALSGVGLRHRRRPDAARRAGPRRLGLDAARARQVFGVPLGDEAKRPARRLVGQLRRAGHPRRPRLRRPRAQGRDEGRRPLRRRFALVLGERDLAAGVVQLKDLADGSQTAIALDGAAAAVDRAVHGA